MAIGVSGRATLKVDFAVKLDMTVEEFEALPEKKQDEAIDASIDWRTTMSNADIDELDVWEYGEIEDK